MNASFFRYALVVVLSWCLGTNADAQLNIKVGYGLSYTNPKKSNRILQNYNTLQDTLLNDRFKDFRLLHGIIAGVRYRIDDTALEATIHSKLSTRRADGTDVSGTDFSRDVLFRLASLSLGFEQYITDRIGLGASIDLDQLRFRTDTQDSNRPYTVLSEWGYGSHFYLSFIVPGNDILTLSVKPFVQVPWGTFDAAPLDTELNAADTLAPDDANDQFLNFGIQLVFYNGVW